MSVWALIIFFAVVVAVRDYSDRTWSATSQVLVSSFPAGGTTLTASGLLAYETEARQIAADLAQIAGTPNFASDVAHDTGLPESAVEHHLSASGSGRLVTIASDATTRDKALRISSDADRQLGRSESTFIGPVEARSNIVRVVGAPMVSRTSAGRIATSLGLRVILGALVALALSLTWEYLDDSIHSPGDLERWLDAPVLAIVRG